MSFTKPLFGLGITINSGTGPHLRLSFTDSDVGAIDIDVTIPAGTYYNLSPGTSGSLAKAIVDACNAAEAAQGGGFTAGLWSSGDVVGGLEYRLQLTRAPGASVLEVDTMDNIEVLTTAVGALRQEDVGFSSATLAPAVGSAGNDYVFRAPHQRGSLWAPRVIADRAQYYPRRIVKSAVSPFDGSSVVHLYSSTTRPDRVEITMEYVPAPLVWHWCLNHSDMVSMVDGLASTDTNVCLETLWTKHATIGPIRFAADATTPDTYDEIEIVDADWLSDLQNGVEETSPAPLLYTVKIIAQEAAT